MCGRVVQKTPLQEIRALFETENPVPNTAPTYNGAPTDALPVVRLDRRHRIEHLARPDRQTGRPQRAAELHQIGNQPPVWRRRINAFAADLA